jgi:L-2-hydroxycarboxylate dehydrogenase (NAD+)
VSTTSESSSQTTRTYASEKLREFSRRVFEHFGVPGDDAALAADVLARSDLRGIDSHGVARLHTYFDMLDHGRINPRPEIRIVRESASTATVDGDNGLGLVVGPRANRIAMDKAVSAGTGWVSVCNTNHYGIAGYYVLEALDRDLIGWSMTNTTPLVAPLFGAEAMLGTNPLAIGFPGAQEPPIVIDMATCAVAYGKIEIARRRGEEIPEGWAIDATGQETRDPQRMMDGGALLPLGSRHAQGAHKGYCLAVLVDVLCSVLSGANFGPFAPPFALQQKAPARQVGKGIGHFFGAMRIDAFIDLAEFKSRIDDYVRTLRATRPVPHSNGPLIPGDPERAAEAIRSTHGIPLVLPVVEDLHDIARRTGIAFD